MLDFARESGCSMPEPPLSPNTETPLLQELWRLHWPQSYLAQASQIAPGAISRLVTGKVRKPHAKTRKKVLIALRQRAKELGVPPANESTLFPASGTPVMDDDQGQNSFVEHTPQMALTTRLSNELEPHDFFAETREKLLIALRQRAEKLDMLALNKTSLFPGAGQHVAYQDQWQQTLVEYAHQINSARRLMPELESLCLARLRFELAHRELEQTSAGTLERWEKAADLIYYAAQRSAQGEPEALEEAGAILNQAQLPWKQAIASALAKYLVLSKRAWEESDHIGLAIACSLRSFQEEPERGLCHLKWQRS